MPERLWFSAEPPIRFGLTTEGDLWIEFDQKIGSPEVPSTPMGLRIPREELKALRAGLGMSRTIEETLSAKPPAQGAH
jgi:hypothetical protein